MSRFSIFILSKKDKESMFFKTVQPEVINKNNKIEMIGDLKRVFFSQSNVG